MVAAGAKRSSMKTELAIAFVVVAAFAVAGLALVRAQSVSAQVTPPTPTPEPTAGPLWTPEEVSAWTSLVIEDMRAELAAKLDETFLLTFASYGEHIGQPGLLHAQASETVYDNLLLIQDAEQQDLLDLRTGLSLSNQMTGTVRDAAVASNDSLVLAQQLVADLLSASPPPPPVMTDQMYFQRMCTEFIDGAGTAGHANEIAGFGVLDENRMWLKANCNAWVGQ